MGKIDLFVSKECQRVRKLLDHYLAGELAVETNQEMLLHLEGCAACREAEQHRRQAREALRDAWNSQTPPADLQKMIIGNLSWKSGFWRGYSRLAAGLLLATVLLGGLLFLPSLDENRVVAIASGHFEEAIDDHLDCSGQPVRSGEGHPLQAIQDDLERELRTIDPSYHLFATNVCQAGEGKFVHYVFENREGFLSLLLEKKFPTEYLRTTAETVSVKIRGMNGILIERELATLVGLEGEDYFVFVVSGKQSPDQAYRLTHELIPHLEKSVL